MSYKYIGTIERIERCVGMSMTDKELDAIGRVGGYTAFHMLSVENWTEGQPIDHWVDENGVDCVKYESGKWFHYRKTAKE